MRKTKIVCTLGPATNSEQMITRLVRAGMDIVRLNFSHGSYNDHRKMIDIIRRVSKKLNTPVAILQDLRGPKLRIGKLKNGSVLLLKGSRVILTVNDVVGDETCISTSYRSLPMDVHPGDNILLDDGLIQLQVKNVKKDHVICKVIEGGKLTDHKGINLPGIKISEPSFTEKDQQDLQFGIEHKVDLIAMSYIRSAQDVLHVKQLIAQAGKEVLLIAKIEKPEAIAELNEILDAADGVMVARGDLGVELPLEKVPPLQKRIIHLALQKGKPVVTATQMLESMRQQMRPTRAEVSDVANAIFDGTDAVMLSSETAVGNYPIETVEIMDRIIQEAESEASQFLNPSAMNPCKTLSIADAISCSACEAAEQLNARAIVAFTTSGFTARMVAKYRPKTRIIAFTTSKLVQHQLNLCWGVHPILIDTLTTTDDIFHQTEQTLLNQKIAQMGDIVVVLLGAPIFRKGTTNLMKLHVIGE